MTLSRLESGPRSAPHRCRGVSVALHQAIQQSRCSNGLSATIATSIATSIATAVASCVAALEEFYPVTLEKEVKIEIDLTHFVEMYESAVYQLKRSRRISAGCANSQLTITLLPSLVLARRSSPSTLFWRTCRSQKARH